MTYTEYTKILTYIKDIIEGTPYENHVFSVGGCERDKHILARDIKDIDLVVNLPNGGIEFAKWLEENDYTSGSVVTFVNYGTAMFHLKQFPHIELEVVQTRKESYRDMATRNPETAYGTIIEDCNRRDFTINSLYHNISTDDDWDLTKKGKGDLKNHIIRSCDNPNIIFKEDPLRILRAIRFACTLGDVYTIEPKTLKGMKDNAYRLSIVSQERITDEITKIIISGKKEGIYLLEETGAFDIVFPELISVKYRILNCVTTQVAFFPFIHSNEKEMRLVAFLAMVMERTPSIDNSFVNGMFKRMRFTNRVINKVNLIAQYIPTVLSSEFIEYPSLVRQVEYNLKTRENVLIMKYVTGYYLSGSSINWNDEGFPMYGYKLPVNGNDIMSILNISPSELIQYAQDDLLWLAFKYPSITKEQCIEYLNGIDPFANKLIKWFCKIFKIRMFQ